MIVIKPVIIFCLRPAAKFLSTTFHNILYAGTTKLGVYKMADTVHGKKEIVQNKCSKQDLILISLLVIVALILKVVGNLFQTVYLDGSMWLRYWTILCAQPKSRLLSFTDWLPAKIELVIAYMYSSGSKFHWEVVLSDNLGDDDILLRYTVWCVPLWLAVQNVHLTDFWESFSTHMETDKNNNSLHVTAQYSIWNIP